MLPGLVSVALLISAVKALHMQILNSIALYQRQYNHTLEIKLTFDEKFAPRLSSASLRLCSLINGLICTCYDEAIYDTNVYISPDCFRMDKFWYSVLLYDQSSMINDPSFLLSNAIFVPAMNDTSAAIDKPIKQVTMILPLTLNDLARSILLFESINFHFSRNVLVCPIMELIIIVPDAQLDLLNTAFIGYQSKFCFPLLFVEESSLLDCPKHVYEDLIVNGNKYALQMALKLLVSERIKTSYYITLDADILMLESFRYEDIIIQDVFGNERALYHNENRFTYHPDWYTGSERTLSITSAKPESQGFGVTPAILSTYGTLLSLSAVRHRYSPTQIQKLPQSSFLRLSSINSFSTVDSSTEYYPWIEWIQSFGNPSIWSEYTIYRIVLDHLQASVYVFHFTRCC